MLLCVVLLHAYNQIINCHLNRQILEHALPGVLILIITTNLYVTYMPLLNLRESLNANLMCLLDYQPDPAADTETSELASNQKHTLELATFSPSHRSPSEAFFIAEPITTEDPGQNMEIDCERKESLTEVPAEVYKSDIPYDSSSEEEDHNEKPIFDMGPGDENNPDIQPSDEPEPPNPGSTEPICRPQEGSAKPVSLTRLVFFLLNEKWKLPQGLYKDLMYVETRYTRQSEREQIIVL